jgi:uncharacterized membrane protein YedE/YeeE
MIEILSQPWPWAISGLMIAFVMFLLLKAGGEFGVSSNLRSMCSIVGAKKLSDFFDFDWKSQKWNLMFVLGSIVGGFLANNFLSSNAPIQLSEATVSALETFDIMQTTAIVPTELFSFESLFTIKGFIIMVVGGFLVGFGSRYAGGCTSGHAISGLSNLQWPSLVAVIGFFIGGLVMTWFILPYILKL